MSSRGRWWRAAVVAGFVLAAVVTAAAAREVPYLGGRVNDLADLLSAPAEARLDARLAAVEAATRAQVAVLTVPSLEGDPIEDYGIHVVETWKLGDADADNGVLLLVARDERQMRIEVGYGLEPVVPDILAVRILREIIEPRFQAGDFDGGVEAGVEALAGLIEGDPDALPQQSRRSSRGSRLGFWILVMIVFILLSNLGGPGARRRRGVRGGMFVPLGGGFGGGFGGGGGGFGGFSGGGGGFGGGGASGSW